MPDDKYELSDSTSGDDSADKDREIVAKKIAKIHKSLAAKDDRTAAQPGQNVPPQMHGAPGNAAEYGAPVNNGYYGTYYGPANVPAGAFPQPRYVPETPAEEPKVTPSDFLKSRLRHRKVSRWICGVLAVIMLVLTFISAREIVMHTLLIAGTAAVFNIAYELLINHQKTDDIKEEYFFGQELPVTILRYTFTFIVSVMFYRWLRHFEAVYGGFDPPGVAGGAKWWFYVAMFAAMTGGIIFMANDIGYSSKKLIGMPNTILAVACPPALLVIWAAALKSGEFTPWKGCRFVLIAAAAIALLAVTDNALQSRIGKMVGEGRVSRFAVCAGMIVLVHYAVRGLLLPTVLIAVITLLTYEAVFVLKKLKLDIAAAVTGLVYLPVCTSLLYYWLYRYQKYISDDPLSDMGTKRKLLVISAVVTVIVCCTLFEVLINEGTFPSGLGGTFTILLPAAWYVLLKWLDRKPVDYCYAILLAQVAAVLTAFLMYYKKYKPAGKSSGSGPDKK